MWWIKTSAKKGINTHGLEFKILDAIVQAYTPFIEQLTELEDALYEEKYKWYGNLYGNIGNDVPMLGTDDDSVDPYGLDAYSTDPWGEYRWDPITRSYQPPKMDLGQLSNWRENQQKRQEQLHKAAEVEAKLDALETTIAEQSSNDATEVIKASGLFKNPPSFKLTKHYKYSNLSAARFAEEDNTIYIQPSYLFMSKMQTSLLHVIIHELTHAFDFDYYPYKVSAEVETGAPPVYYNIPMEVRAYMETIWRDIEDYLYEGMTSDDFMNVVRHDHQFKNMYQHLNEKNRKYLLSMLYNKWKN